MFFDIFAIVVIFVSFPNLAFSYRHYYYYCCFCLLFFALVSSSCSATWKTSLLFLLCFRASAALRHSNRKIYKIPMLTVASPPKRSLLTRTLQVDPPLPYFARRRLANSTLPYKSLLFAIYALAILCGFFGFFSAYDFPCLGLE